LAVHDEHGAWWPSAFEVSRFWTHCTMTFVDGNALSINCTRHDTNSVIFRTIKRRQLVQVTLLIYQPFLFPFYAYRLTP